MICSSPQARIVKHFKLAKVVLPHNMMLTDFVVYDIKVSKYDIELSLAHKNHYFVIPTKDIEFVKDNKKKLDSELS